MAPTFSQRIIASATAVKKYGLQPVVRISGMEVAGVAPRIVQVQRAAVGQRLRRDRRIEAAVRDARSVNLWFTDCLVSVAPGSMAATPHNDAKGTRPIKAAASSGAVQDWIAASPVLCTGLSWAACSSVLRDGAFAQVHGRQRGFGLTALCPACGPDLVRRLSDDPARQNAWLARRGAGLTRARPCNQASRQGVLGGSGFVSAHQDPRGLTATDRPVAVPCSTPGD